MTPEQIEKIFHAARELEGAERNAFLEKQCAGDADALRDLQQLLLSHEAGSNILDQPAIDKIPPDIWDHDTIPEISRSCPPRLSQDQLLASRYRVISGPYEGAMGQVYRAWDTALERDVALKVLPDRFARKADWLSRFKREAQVLASLKHPNICAVHDIRDDDGIHYIVMEYIEGETLLQRLERPLTVDDFKKIAEGCLEALKVAHEKTILHRDIKPANIMLDVKGQVKLLDFGLAKPQMEIAAAHERAQSKPMPYLAGTLAYMAPELSLSREPDVRSDIYSLGLVFYELVYGRYPSSEHERRTLKPDPRVSRGLNRILRKMLSEDPLGRYESATTILEDFRRSFTVGRLRRVVAVALLMTLSAVAMPGVPGKIILAVLGFEAIGGHTEDRIYADGWMDLVTGKLCRLNTASVQVLCPLEVHTAKVITPCQARSELGANVVLSGTIKRTPEHMVIDYSLGSPCTNRVFLKNLFETRGADPNLAQSEFVSALLRDLKLKFEWPQPPQDVIRDPSPAAKDSYILGRGYLRDYENGNKIDKAINAFEDAVRIETNYAEAYAGLGEAYWRRYQDTGNPDWIPIALKQCEQSVTINSYLPEARTCLGALHNARGDYESAIRELEVALKLQPENDLAFRQLAESKRLQRDFQGAEQVYLREIRLRPYYWPSHTALGLFYYGRDRYAEAAQQYEEALRLAPDNGSAYYSLGGTYILMNRYDDAIRMLQKASEIRPNYQTFSNLGSVYIRTRQFDGAVDAFEHSVRLNNRDFIAIGNLARAYYFAPGKRQQARAQYELAIERGQERFQVNPRDGDAHIMLSRYNAMIGKRDEALLHLEQALISEKRTTRYLYQAAVVYAVIGDSEKALSYLKEAVEQGFSKTEIRDTIEFDNLRDDPRFRRLIAPN